jgi:hypoxanthine phosphoribosyltransferase
MEILLPAERIQTRVAELARHIAADYHNRPITIVGVLTGSLIFLADLVRHLDLPLRIGLIQASSYRGTATAAGELHIQPELVPDVRGRHILLIDDILDTGQTLAYLSDHLRNL